MPCSPRTPAAAAVACAVLSLAAPAASADQGAPATPPPATSTVDTGAAPPTADDPPAGESPGAEPGPAGGCEQDPVICQGQGPAAAPPAGGRARELPRTGSEPLLQLLGAGTALLALGTLSARAGRRRADGAQP